MESNKEVEVLRRVNFRWKMSTLVFGVMCVGIFIWGYGKKIEVDRAIIEGQRVMESIISLKQAFGISAENRISDGSFGSPSIQTYGKPKIRIDVGSNKAPKNE